MTIRIETDPRTAILPELDCPCRCRELSVQDLELGRKCDMCYFADHAQANARPIRTLGLGALVAIIDDAKQPADRDYHHDTVYDIGNVTDGSHCDW